MITLLLFCLLQADLVLRGGPVITVDPENPEADAVAIQGNKIVAVGRASEMTRWIGDNTEVIELNGHSVIPGFIESHGHYVGVGQSELGVHIDLGGTTSAEDVAERVRLKAVDLPSGTWILGRGWDQNDWPNKEMPDHRLLDAATERHPVVLTRVDGHATWCNMTALNIGGINEHSVDPVGGEIIRFPESQVTRGTRGTPTGVLVDTAKSLVNRHMPSSTADDIDASLDAAAEACLRLGITSFHDAGEDLDTLELMRKKAEAFELPVRLYVMVAGSDSRFIEHLEDFRPEIGLGNGFLTYRAIKLYADGALGSRGAALLEDYSDRKDHKGLAIIEKDLLTDLSKQALIGNWQVCVHAIGDAANRLALDAYEEAFKTVDDGPSRRFRIEHSQIVHKRDLPRFARLGIIAAMQGVHCTSDFPWALERIGQERAKEGAYAWRTLLDMGTIICNGTDAPVERLSPIECYYASVTRKHADGTPKEGYFPEQRMTRLEALQSYTIWGAYAAFQEKELGSITVGKLADLTVLSENILTCPEPDILKTKVLTTVVDGKVAYP